VPGTEVGLAPRVPTAQTTAKLKPSYAYLRSGAVADSASSDNVVRQAVIASKLNALPMCFG
jgi:hypothetical protein